MEPNAGEKKTLLQPQGPSPRDSVFRFSNFLSQKPFLVSFGAALFFPILTYFFFGPHYLYNDDVQLLLLLKGVALDQAPSALNARENILLCTLLKNLYVLFPRIQWYSCMLVFTQFLYLWATLASFQYGGGRNFRSLLFLFAFLGIGVYFFSNLQWTMTASLAAIGAFYLFTALWKEKTRNPPFIAYVLIFLLVTLSIQIRYPSFFLIAVLGIPMVWFLTHKKTLTEVQHSILLFLGFTFLSAFSAIAFNHFYYQRAPGWGPFIDFFDQHFELHETRDPVFDPDSEPLFASMGWTKNDLALFQDWYFMDEDKYSVEHLKKLSQYFPKFDINKPTNYSFVKKISFPTTQLVLYFFLAGLFLVPRGSLRLMLASALWTFLVLFFLMGYEKLPERVYLPALFFLYVMTIFFSVPKWEKRPQTQKRSFLFVPLASLLILFLLGFSGYYLFREHARNRRWIECEGLMKTYLGKLHSNDQQLYIIWGPNFPFEFFNAFDDFEVYRHLNIIPLTWLQRSPTVQVQLNRFGIKNLFRDLVDNPRFFLVCSPMETKGYQIYLMEKYHMDTKLEMVYTCPLFSTYLVHSLRKDL